MQFILGTSEKITLDEWLAKAAQADLFAPKQAESVPVQQELASTVKRTGSQQYYIGPRGGKWADAEHTIPWGGEGGGLEGQTTILKLVIKDISKKEHESVVVRDVIKHQGAAFVKYMKEATVARGIGDSKAEYQALAQAVAAGRNMSAAYKEIGGKEGRRGEVDFINYTKRAERQRDQAYNFLNPPKEDYWTSRLRSRKKQRAQKSVNQETDMSKSDLTSLSKARQGATPVGGITPGGFKRVSEKKYVPVRGVKQLSREDTAAKKKVEAGWRDMDNAPVGTDVKIGDATFTKKNSEQWASSFSPSLYSSEHVKDLQKKVHFDKSPVGTVIHNTTNGNIWTKVSGKKWLKEKSDEKVHVKDMAWANMTEGSGGNSMDKSDITPAKARKMLHDKQAQGHPLTEPQRKFFGAVAGAKARKSDDGKPGESLEETSTEELERKLKGFTTMRRPMDDPKRMDAINKRREAITAELKRRTEKGCATPGMKIRSGGQGRGEARGNGQGPMRGGKSEAASADCATPGEKIRSGGKGRGLARGGGHGPIGRMGKSGIDDLDDFAKAGPFIGPRGGKWADAKHTVPWQEGVSKESAESSEGGEKTTGTKKIMEIAADAEGTMEQAEGLLAKQMGPLANATQVSDFIERLQTSETATKKAANDIEALIGKCDSDTAARARGFVGSLRETSASLAGRVKMLDRIRTAKAQQGVKKSGINKSMASWLEENTMEKALPTTGAEGGHGTSWNGLDMLAAYGQDGLSKGIDSNDLDRWTNNFYEDSGLKIRALECAKDTMELDRDLAAWRKTETPWRDRYEWSLAKRDAYSDQWDKERSVFSKRGDEIRQRMAGLDVELIDYRIKAAKAQQMAKKSGFDDLDDFAKGGPYVGPRGGKWADAKHTIPWGSKPSKKKYGAKPGSKDDFGDIFTPFTSPTHVAGDTEKEHRSRAEMKDLQSKLTEATHGAKAFKGPERQQRLAKLWSRVAVLHRKLGDEKEAKIADEWAASLQAGGKGADPSGGKGGGKKYGNATVHSDGSWAISSSSMGGPRKTVTYNASTIKDAIGKDFDGKIPSNPWQKITLPYPAGETDAISLLMGRARPDKTEKQEAKAQQMAKKSGFDDLDDFAKGGPYIGPRGGKWADAKHTVPWDEKTHGGNEGKDGGGEDAGTGKRMLSSEMLGEMIDAVTFRKRAAEGIKHQGAPYPGFAKMADNAISHLRAVSTESLIAGKKRAEVSLARMQGKSWERPIIVPESLWDSPPVVMKRGIQILDSILKEREKETKKSGFDDLDDFAKGGPYVGPRGGKWADAKHTIPWKDEGSKTGKKDGSDPSGRLKELSIAHQSALRSQVKAGLLAEQIEKQTQKTITSSKVADSAYERAWDMREGANRKLAVAERAVREIESQMEKLPGGEDLADLNFKRRSNDIGKSMHAEQGSELAKSFYESKDVLDWANRFWDGKSVQIEALALAKELLELRQKFGGGDSPIAATKNIDTEYEKKRKAEDAIVKKMHALEIKHLDTERKRTEARAKIAEARAKIDKSESQRFEALTPARQRDMTAHEQAGRVSRLRKGEDVYVATIGLAPPPQPSAPLEKGRTGHQGVVAYSEGSDMEVSRLFKSGDDFYTGGSPSVIPFSRPIGVGKVCPACGTAMSKSLTACPACGAGTVTHRVLPRGEAPGDEGDGSASIRKSRSGLLKPHIVKDVKFDR